MSAPLLLNPGLRRLWRGESCLQLGVDPATAIVIDGLTSADEALLTLLDGTRTLKQASRAAGVPQQRAEELVGLLERAGALTGDVATLPGSLRPDALALALATGRDGAEIIKSRQSSRVDIFGHGRVAARLAETLRASGVGHHVPSSRPPDLVVLAPPGCATQPEWRTAVRDLPHLEVAIRETTAQVGPLVLPGRTPCLRCAELARADRDPAWPTLSAQLAGSPRAIEPSDHALATMCAGLAALHILRWLDHGDEMDHPLIGGVLQLSLRDLRLRRRTLLPHAACGCRAAQ